MTEISRIASRDNKRLKHARSVREGKIKAAVFIEGVRHAEEALRSNAKIIECLYEEKFGENERGKELINKITAKYENTAVVESRVFTSITETNTPQGIVLIVQKPLTTEENFDMRLRQTAIKHSPVVFLSEINNPFNLGAILRTAEAAGAAGVIVSTNSADAFSPKSTRAALGANLRLPIWENVQLKKILNWANENQIVVTAADINARKKYTEIDWTVPRLVVFGSEAHGLSENARQRIGELIHIPMENDVESLNLAVSCGIILYEARRQNSKS